MVRCVCVCACVCLCIYVSLTTESANFWMLPQSRPVPGAESHIMQSSIIFKYTFKQHMWKTKDNLVGGNGRKETTWKTQT
jgi:hypothetical protein